MSIIDKIGVVPNVPNWDKTSKIKDFEVLNNISYKDLDDLNEQLIQVTRTMNEINTKLSAYERQQAKLEVQYNRAYRKVMLESNLSSESQKRLYAQTECEELEMKSIYCKQIIGELKRHSNMLRTTLDVLQTIGNNVRKEMGM